MLGATSESLEIGDLPIVTANMRATTLFHCMRTSMRRVKLRPLTFRPSFLCLGRRNWQWKPRLGSGWELMYRLAKVNVVPFTDQIALATVSACLFYTPAFVRTERSSCARMFLTRLPQVLTNARQFFGGGQTWRGQGYSMGMGLLCGVVLLECDQFPR